MTDQRLLPPWGGNRVRILGLIRSLRTLGWDVVLVTAHSNEVEALLGLVDKVFVVSGRAFRGGALRRFDVGPYRRAVAELAAKLRPAVVIAEYAWIAPSLLAAPKAALKIVDCHDVLFERTARFREAGLDPWVICTRDEERRLLNSADVLITTQHREQVILKRLMPRSKVVCLLPEIGLPPRFQRTSPDSSIVLAVGANHAGNDGIRHFAASHWARILSRNPEATMYIAGGIGTRIDSAPGIQILGDVADLYAYYASASVILCPIEVGTGVKVKFLEALRLGKAVVATGTAAEGLPVPDNQAWLTADSLADCADAVTSLLSAHGRRFLLEEAAFAYGEQHLSLEHSVGQLRAMLPGGVP